MKLIIENRSEIVSDIDALQLVSKVVDGGRVSNGGKQYCYMTVFDEVCVSTELNKKSDKFIVWDRH